MKKLKLAILLASSLVLIGFLIIFDYSNLTARSNLGFALGIIAAICNIIAMILTIRSEEKKP
jgi:uncharacterized membrane protein required for colicin V production